MRLYEVLRALKKYREAALVYEACGLGLGQGAAEGSPAPVAPSELAAQARYEELTYLQLPLLAGAGAVGEAGAGAVGEAGGGAVGEAEAVGEAGAVAGAVAGVVVVDSAATVRLAAAALGIDLDEDDCPSGASASAPASASAL